MEQQASNWRWSDYYSALEGRKPRALCVEVLEHWRATATDRGPGYAIDLGCGDGTETLLLLERGWHVLAVDREPAAIALVQAKARPEYAARLETRIASFEQLIIPPADLIFASASLPFCRPEYFEEVWARIVAAIRIGGRFAGQFFGDRDAWAADRSMTFHTAEQVARLLSSFDVELLREREFDDQGIAGGRGPKHWHSFEVVARRTAR